MITKQGHCNVVARCPCGLLTVHVQNVLIDPRSVTSLPARGVKLGNGKQSL